MSSLIRIAVLTGVAALGYYAARGARSSLNAGWQRHGGEPAMPLGDGMAATPPTGGVAKASSALNPGEALNQQSRPAAGFPSRDSNDGKGVAPGLGDYARGA
ncbi:hypothetical protein [Roseateles terrae]|uniref:Uncharacterized protein n=1 Tax=Roseateles terrae TaxID=431060 RepID=A0ABR6GTU7_9BURK|nr:hypothetical protein [Roseateles terrae]MBB3195527.1 hypothetical protein [Roseateles terrae]OWQ86444.1 hypothetical protein CDN98_11865 [Roseateles terrae]